MCASDGAQSRQFEAAGLGRELAEQLATYITELIVLSKVRTEETFVSKVYLEKVRVAERRAVAGAASRAADRAAGGAQLRGHWQGWRPLAEAPWQRRGGGGGRAPSPRGRRTPMSTLWGGRGAGQGRAEGRKGGGRPVVLRPSWSGVWLCVRTPHT